jgi:protein arginine kinase activator
MHGDMLEMLTEEPDMKCQSCSSKATVHFTDIIKGNKQEVHLCQSCAEQKQLIKNQELNFPAILQNLIGQHIGQLTDELARLTCPACGIKYMEFRAEGRLGCPHDYEVFRAGLEPLLRRLHRSVRHKGKAPRYGQSCHQNSVQVIELRHRLRHAVEAEAYEEAALLRDQIRQKEAADGP